MTPQGVLPGSTSTGPASQVWSSPEWMRAATAWIDEVLERRGIARVPITPRQPRVRPWSTQLVVETSQGRAWFKAGLPEQSPEAALLHELASVAPDLMPTTWAHDLEAGWILMPEQGPVLRDVADADTITSLLSGLLRRYGRLQRASVTVLDELRRYGVPSFTPADLVAAWSDRVSGDVRARGLGRLQDAAGRLDALGMPDTVQHDDLHAGNVFSPGGGSGDVQSSTIFDWGDCYIGQPMLSLLITLRGPSYHFGLPVDPGRDRRLLRAYAAGWASQYSMAELDATLEDALLLARVGRVLGWERALARATQPERAEWEKHPQQWMSEIQSVLF